MKSIKTYKIWELVRKRVPGEIEVKYQTQASAPLELVEGLNLLYKLNNEKKKTENKGGIEYQTSYQMKIFERKKMPSSVETFSGHDDEINAQWVQKEKDNQYWEPEKEEFDANDLDKQHATDPIIISPTEAGPATITVVSI
jgi:hypothetical protein